MDPLGYNFRQPMLIRKLAKWQMLLSEFEIVYIAQKAVKGQALADLLAGSPVDDHRRRGSGTVEAMPHKLVTKKVVSDFVRSNIICRFSIPESIIIDNGANLNIHLMKDIYEKLEITHRNSTTYRPQMNGAVEAANKNINRILRKMTDNYKGWNGQLSYALLGYCATARTSTGATPYLIVYGTKAVIPVEVEIPSLRIMPEAELDNAEWVRARYEKVALIDEKRMVFVWHG
ncbi:uncharacterized protein LOC132619884 [Lycium barbarum]|uniref:uncharacterized protein LOC132619884 n=1 Tax=Lycium barbarum TaxID=112863 RepID=UPI00293E1020|nr:uncharacterized protein LOC132619884 [Lycium barbarum]